MERAARHRWPSVHYPEIVIVTFKAYETTDYIKNTIFQGEYSTHLTKTGGHPQQNKNGYYLLDCIYQQHKQGRTGGSTVFFIKLYFLVE